MANLLVSWHVLCSLAHERCYLLLTCFFFSLNICCSTLAISRSTRSMLWISSSLDSLEGDVSWSSPRCNAAPPGDGDSTLTVNWDSWGKEKKENIDKAHHSPKAGDYTCILPFLPAQLRDTCGFFLTAQYKCINSIQSHTHRKLGWPFWPPQ